MQIDVAKMRWEAAKTRDKLERPEWERDFARRPDRQSPVTKTRAKNDPNEAVPFTAQYPGTCYLCQKRFWAGTKITYFPNRPRERRACHQACEVSELGATRG